MNQFFSIIIPSYNEEINLPLLLASIAKQTDYDFEVIVVDNFSKDKTKENSLKIQNLPSFQFIQHHAKFVSAARNYGAKQAKGNYLIFFDADVEVEKDFIKEIKKHILDNNLDDLTVWNRPKEKTFTGRFILGLANYNMFLFQKIKPAANGPCIIMKKSLFEKIKGFDESIVFGEDFDLIQKAQKENAKFAVFKEPKLYISTRRFDKEGLFLSLYKSLKAIVYQLFFGPIRRPIFKYEMGGQYYKKNS